MKEVGRHIVEALRAESEEERVRFRGEDEGVCPVRHCDMLTAGRDRSGVECPVCGIAGRLSIVDGRITVEFSEAEQKRSRLHWEGKLEHSTEIKTKAVGPGQIADLKEQLAKYQRLT